MSKTVKHYILKDVNSQVNINKKRPQIQVGGPRKSDLNTKKQ